MKRADRDDPVAAVRDRCRFPAPPTAVTCAVSGGPDSLALLVLAVDAGLTVTAAHVDHGLRPGSGADAAVVADAAARFGAAFRGERVVVEPGPDLEARARRARHGVLPRGTLFGHTMDDQAETVVLALLRGTGLDGLRAMTPDRHPILALRRDETAAVCEAVGLQPVRDETNEDPRFRRNRVRNEVLPLLADVADRDVAPLLARTAELVEDDLALLDGLAAELDPTDAPALASAPPAPAGDPDLAAGVRPRPPPARSSRGRTRPRRRPRRGRGRAGGRRHRGPTVGPAARRAPLVPPIRGRRAGRTERLGCARVAGDDEDQLLDDQLPDDQQLGETILTREQLRDRIAELGKEIAADYEGRAPILVSVLKGAFVFVADLVREIDIPLEVDFMAVSSYGASTRSSGVVRIVKDLDIDLTGRHVIIVEDIIDSGLTLRYLRKTLRARGPASLEICALLVREGNQEAEVDLRYVGFRIPPAFVVGYGLAVAERYRNVPDIRTYLGEE